MSRPWIKHWVKKLSDPKIARLPDWLWRRLGEFELLAGYEDADGKLPPVDDICWMLHLAPNKVEDALHELSKVGVVHQETDGSWWITNFNYDQNSQSKERTRAWRERKRHSDGHSDSDDSPSTSPSDSISEIIRIYEGEIGIPTKTICDLLTEAVGEYSGEWIAMAIKEAARNNKRSWSYVEAILKRWKVEGFQTRKPPKNGNGSGHEITQNPDGSFNV